jgi:hypothetical protein
VLPSAVEHAMLASLIASSFKAVLQCGLWRMCQVKMLHVACHTAFCKTYVSLSTTVGVLNPASSIL